MVVWGAVSGVLWGAVPGVLWGGVSRGVGGRSLRVVSRGADVLSVACGVIIVLAPPLELKIKTNSGESEGNCLFRTLNIK